VVYLLTQVPLIVTTMHIFVFNGMRGHLALSLALALELGQVRPRTRLEIRLGLWLRLG